MKKSISIFFMLFILLTLLSGCSTQDAGIIQWNYKNNSIDWKDVDNAAYYQLIFYEDDLETELYNLIPTYSYDSIYSLYQSDNNTTYNLIIKVFYEDGTQEESDWIQFTINRDYQYPTFSDVQGVFLSHFSWTDIGVDDDDLVNYTLKIDNNEYTVETNSYDLSELSEGIHEIKVRANYSEGSSIWSEICYLSISVEIESLNVYYDISSSEDFTYTIDGLSDVIYIKGYYNLDVRKAPISGVVTVSGDTINVNRYYLLNETFLGGNTLYQSNPIFFEILTDQERYILFITDIQE